MARTQNRLTAKQVENAKRPGMLCDGGGLYLQVHSASSKSWIYRFKRNGRARDMGLGAFAADDADVGLTLAKAREEAARWRKVHKDEGKDPIEERVALHAQEAAKKQSAAVRAVTFRDCAEQLIASHEASWKNEKHRAQWRNTLETYAYPILGDVPVADVDTALVMKVLEQPIEEDEGEALPLWRARTETASRVRGRIERVLSSAKARGLRQGENPAQWRGHLDALLPVRSKVRPVTHHPALPWARMPAFMGRLRERDGITARALEFTILTAVRTNETIGAAFDEFDLAAKTWVIPAHRMKAGQEHRTPLCSRAVAIVKEMAGTRLNDFVFPGTKRDSGLSDMAMLMLLRDLDASVTVHGFRSSFRDWAGESTNHPHDVCEAALAHTRKDKTHAAYQRGDLFAKRRKLMEDWAAFCDPPRKAKRKKRPPVSTEEPRESRDLAGLPIRKPTLREASDTNR
jgi:integrase